MSKIKSITLTALIVAIFTACGGGGSSSDNNNTTIEDIENGIERAGDINSTEEIPDINISDKIPDTNNTITPEIEDINISNLIKKGFYVDSPIEGVDYRCGDQIGTTDSNGTFRFEDGKTCVFTLAGVVLREFNTTNLEDNIIIVEDNIENARLLQILDVDGDNSNGIQLTKDVLDELVNSGIDTLPASNEDIERLFENLQDVEGYKGALVSIEEAREHLKKTIEELNLDINQYLELFPTQEEIENTSNEIDNLFSGL